VPDKNTRAEVWHQPFRLETAEPSAGPV
ncbi:uncharacterized protein METZ01_LOCUS461450, partial [marine metagenome]